MAHAQPAEVSSIGRSRTLAIDVGGTGLKASVIDDSGKLLTERVRVDTPVGATWLGRLPDVPPRRWPAGSPSR